MTSNMNHSNSSCEEDAERGASQAPPEKHYTPEQLALLHAAVFEELGNARKDSLPLQDRGGFQDNLKPLHKRASSNPWANHVFDDIDPSLEGIDPIMNGQLARSRRGTSNGFSTRISAIGKGDRSSRRAHKENNKYQNPGSAHDFHSSRGGKADFRGASHNVGQRLQVIDRRKRAKGAVRMERVVEKLRVAATNDNQPHNLRMRVLIGSNARKTTGYPQETAPSRHRQMAKSQSSVNRKPHSTSTQQSTLFTLANSSPEDFVAHHLRIKTASTTKTAAPSASKSVSSASYPTTKIDGETTLQGSIWAPKTDTSLSQAAGAAHEPASTAQLARAMTLTRRVPTVLPPTKLARESTLSGSRCALGMACSESASSIVDTQHLPITQSTSNLQRTYTAPLDVKSDSEYRDLIIKDSIWNKKPPTISLVQPDSQPATLQAIATPPPSSVSTNVTLGGSRWAPEFSTKLTTMNMADNTATATSPAISHQASIQSFQDHFVAAPFHATHQPERVVNKEIVKICRADLPGILKPATIEVIRDAAQNLILRCVSNERVVINDVITDNTTLFALQSTVTFCAAKGGNTWLISFRLPCDAVRFQNTIVPGGRNLVPKPALHEDGDLICFDNSDDSHEDEPVRNISTSFISASANRFSYMDSDFIDSVFEKLDNGKEQGFLTELLGMVGDPEINEHSTFEDFVNSLEAIEALEMIIREFFLQCEFFVKFTEAEELDFIENVSPQILTKAVEVRDNEVSSNQIGVTIEACQLQSQHDSVNVKTDSTVPDCIQYTTQELLDLRGQAASVAEKIIQTPLRRQSVSSKPNIRYVPAIQPRTSIYQWQSFHTTGNAVDDTSNVDGDFLTWTETKPDSSPGKDTAIDASQRDLAVQSAVLMSAKSADNTNTVQRDYGAVESPSSIKSRETDFTAPKADSVALEHVQCLLDHDNNGDKPLAARKLINEISACITDVVQASHSQEAMVYTQKPTIAVLAHSENGRSPSNSEARATPNSLHTTHQAAEIRFQGIASSPEDERAFQGSKSDPGIPVSAKPPPNLNSNIKRYGRDVYFLGLANSTTPFSTPANSPNGAMESSPLSEMKAGVWGMNAEELPGGISKLQPQHNHPVGQSSEFEANKEFKSIVLSSTRQTPAWIKTTDTTDPSRGFQEKEPNDAIAALLAADMKVAHSDIVKKPASKVMGLAASRWAYKVGAPVFTPSPKPQSFVPSGIDMASVGSPEPTGKDNHYTSSVNQRMPPVAAFANDSELVMATVLVLGPDGALIPITGIATEYSNNYRSGDLQYPSLMSAKGQSSSVPSRDNLSREQETNARPALSPKKENIRADIQQRLSQSVAQRFKIPAP